MSAFRGMLNCGKICRFSNFSADNREILITSAKNCKSFKSRHFLQVFKDKRAVF